MFGVHSKVNTTLFAFLGILIMLAYLTAGCKPLGERMQEWRERRQEQREERKERWDQWRDDRQEERDDRRDGRRRFWGRGRRI
ncbi:MAG: hypothetical protein AAF394_03830 [Planctomycetota bacterium]